MTILNYFTKRNAVSAKSTPLQLVIYILAQHSMDGTPNHSSLPAGKYPCVLAFLGVDNGGDVVLLYLCFFMAVTCLTR